MQNFEKDISLSSFVNLVNNSKKLFTPGPGSLNIRNLMGIRQVFGRGDEEYDSIENTVISLLNKMTGKENTVRMQGSSTLAIEIMLLNFLCGDVLLVETGYYSDRMKSMLNDSRIKNNIKTIKSVSWDELDSVSGKFDWVIACSVETSKALKLPIKLLYEVSRRLSAKLMLDATASIGLEDNHELADVISYSSCKGLFGFTGAAFIGYDELLINEVDSFYLNINTHLNKKITGPYHAICSLYNTLINHDLIKESVLINKRIFMEKFSDYLVYKNVENQPNLCTLIDAKLCGVSSNCILYVPREIISGSVVCHLGEIELEDKAQGKILDFISLCQ